MEDNFFSSDTDLPEAGGSLPGLYFCRRRISVKNYTEKDKRMGEP